MKVDKYIHEIDECFSRDGLTINKKKLRTIIREIQKDTIKQVLKLPIKDAWLPDYKSSAMCIMVEEIEMLKDRIEEQTNDFD